MFQVSTEWTWRLKLSLHRLCSSCLLIFEHSGLCSMQCKQSAFHVFCIPGVIYESVYRSSHNVCKKGLHKALILKEVAPLNSVQVPNITIRLELLYKPHRSLSGNLSPLWSWKREQKPWWHSLYIKLKLLQFLYLFASYSLNSFAVWESETSSNERCALWDSASINQVHKKKHPKCLCHFVHLKDFPQNWP